MKPGNTYTSKQSFALLLVGEPKSGKTNVAFSFPNPWILDCDRNLKRAATVVKDKTWFFDDPYVDDKDVELPEHQRWNRAVDKIKLAAKAPEVQTIVIDGLGALADMLIAHIIEEVRRNEPNSKADGKLRIQDYQPLALLLTKLIMGLRNSGKLIVFTSHQKVDKDEHTGKTRYELNMPGKLANSFGGLFSDVWATTAENAGLGKYKYLIHTRPSGLHMTLGTSLALPGEPIDVTDKSPSDIWKIIGPKVLT